MEKKHDLKVTIAVHAKYQAFRLVEGLDAAGVLDTLYTVYPKFKIPPYKINLARVRSFNFLGALRYVNVRLGIELSDEIISYLYDHWVAFNLKKPKGKWVFHGWSGFSLMSLQKAKKLGGVAVVDRACPHIDFQQELIAEEKTRLLGRPFVPERKKLFDKMKREYEIADYIMVPSEYSRKSFIERGFDPLKVIAIPLCNEKLTVPKAEENKIPHKFTVLCVGGIFYRKGMYYLLKAWEELALQDAELILKSAIPSEFPELLNIPNVRYLTHYVSDEEIAKLYQSASIFVLPSLDDGFGMVVAEAMAAGLPVIVTENVGISDGVEQGRDGFVVPIRDVGALKEKIKYFYDNPEEVKRMGVAAIEKAKQYTPEAYAKRMIEVYKRISTNQL